MARNIDSWERRTITYMIYSKNRLTTSQMTRLAQCSQRSINISRKNLRLFGSARSPLASVSRQGSTSVIMIDTLCDHLVEKPGLYVETLAIFLWNEFNILPSSLASNALFRRLAGQKKAKEQNFQLQYGISNPHKLHEFGSYHLVFVEESG